MPGGRRRPPLSSPRPPGIGAGAAAEPAPTARSWHGAQLRRMNRGGLLDNARQTARIAMACGDSLAAPWLPPMNPGATPRCSNTRRPCPARHRPPDLEPLVAWSTHRRCQGGHRTIRTARGAVGRSRPGVRPHRESQEQASMSISARLRNGSPVARILGAGSEIEPSHASNSISPNASTRHATAPGASAERSMPHWCIAYQQRFWPGPPHHVDAACRRGGHGGQCDCASKRRSVAAGQPTGNADRLTPDCPDAYPPLEEDKTAQGRVSARWELPISPFGSLGSSPTGGAVSSTPPATSA